MIYIGAAKLIADRNREQGEKIGVTNGCFDLFHPGHVQFLAHCASLCSFLLVGINTDKSVQRIKGPTRPILPDSWRLSVVQACRYVGQAFLFPEDTFESSIMEIRPHIWFKGSDYTLQTLNKQEVEAANSVGCEICIIQEAIPSIRTTTVLDRILGTLCLNLRVTQGTVNQNQG